MDVQTETHVDGSKVASQALQQLSPLTIDALCIYVVGRLSRMGATCIVHGKFWQAGTFLIWEIVLPRFWVHPLLRYTRPHSDSIQSW